MLYQLTTALLFGVLFGESAYARNSGAGGVAAVVAFVGTFVSLALPALLLKYSNENEAPVVLTRLMQRGGVGSGVILLTALGVWLAVGRLADPGLFGEFYLYTALGIFLFQGFGGVITPHVMYLQQTHQYNSNQLVAVLITLTLLLFVLVLYFLAFDLSRPPEFHAYFRDLVAITLTLVGYGRAVYLMAHH